MARPLTSVLLWVGAALVFADAWLVMWWIALLWRSATPATLSSTIWAFGGLVLMLIVFSAPVKIALLVIGGLRCADDGTPRS